MRCVFILGSGLVVVSIACGDAPTIEGGSTDDVNINHGDAGQSSGDGAAGLSGAASPPPISANPKFYCGGVVCADSEECCFGGLIGDTSSPDGAAIPLQTCAPTGTCNRSLATECTWAPNSRCPANEVCCITEPTPGQAFGQCATSCAINGETTLQVCATDSDCPANDACVQEDIDGSGSQFGICARVVAFK